MFASSSPVRTRASIPYSSRTRETNAGPLDASRVALVRTPTTRWASSCEIFVRYSSSAAVTRAIASSASAPVPSTPWPSRVMIDWRSSSSTWAPATSAIRSRVEFVPMSTTATRMAGRTVSGGRVTDVTVGVQ